MLQTKEDRLENNRIECPTTERERLISEHLHLIKFHASRLATQLFSAKGADQLLDAGVIGLIGAVTTYDEGSELEFGLRRPVHSSSHDRATPPLEWEMVAHQP